MNKTLATPQENIISILPAIIVGIILLVVTTISILLIYPDLSIPIKIGLGIYGLGGSIYIGLYYWAYIALPQKAAYAWGNACIAGGGLGIMIFLMPVNLELLIYPIIFVTILASSVISNQSTSYFLVIIIAVFHGVFHFLHKALLVEWIIHVLSFVVAFIIITTIHQIKLLSSRQIKRLEIVNEISAQMGSTLETKQLISLLRSALQNTLEADTYYFGTQNGDLLKMQLFIDEGTIFNDIHYDLKRSLSGWVIKNQEPLWISDLRKPLPITEIEVFKIGKPKYSLSWMGVPVTGEFVKGIIVIASYHPNAFNRSDFELLINIAQRAALALDNSYQHALVEEQARLDSLTRVYNHGYFIKTLHQQAEQCNQLGQSLSLIMLDLDHFKQYNDSFGHTMGDEILVSLCKAIQNHIKQGDAVGRWGGEEFAISLPNTTAEQALQVAQRIRRTMAEFTFVSNDHKFIPVPTVSMGIAVFPNETNEVAKLIDIADKRLYIAKERGRDQIESMPVM